MDGIIAGVHRFSLAGVALEAEQDAPGSAPLSELIPLRDGIATTMESLAVALTGKPAPALSDLGRLHLEVWEKLSAAAPPGETPGHLSTHGPHGLLGAEGAMVVEQIDVMLDAVDTIAGLVATKQVAPEEHRPR